MSARIGPLAWAFWSPRRLGAVAGAGLLALVAGIGAVSAALTPDGPHAGRPAAAAAVADPAATAAAPTSTSATSTSATPDLAGDPGAGTEDVAAGPAPYGPATADADAARVARAFVKAWLKGPHAKSDKAWRAALKPYVTTELLAGLERTDRDRVPTAKLAPDAPAVRTLGEYVSELTVRLADGRGVDVTVSYDGSVWRVANLDGPAAPDKQSG